MQPKIFLKSGSQPEELKQYLYHIPDNHPVRQVYVRIIGLEGTSMVIKSNPLNNVGTSQVLFPKLGSLLYTFLE